MTRDRVRRSLIALSPAGLPQSHASTLLVRADGSLLVAWFSGSHEGAADSRILVTGGVPGQFPEPHIVGDAPVAHWNPVLADGPDGRIWLFFRRGPSIEAWTTWVCHSSDGGCTWDEPSEVVPGSHSRGPVRQAPVWSAGWWIAPGSVEVWSPEPRWDCFVDLTREGTTWSAVPIPLDHLAVAGAGAIQPAVCRGSAVGLVALARSSGGRVLRSATDDPTDWPPFAPCQLPNNNSGLAAVTLDDGTIVCAHNPGEEDWGSRSPLVLSVSHDDGLTWRRAATLDDGTARTGPVEKPLPVRSQLNDGSPSGAFATGVVTSGIGEYSYPSIAVTAEAVLVTYTWQRLGIALAEVPLAELGSSHAVPGP